VPITAFDLDRLPAHLRVTFAVEAPDGTEVARSKNLEALQTRLAGQASRAVADAVAGDLQRSGLRGWPEDLLELPQTVQSDVGGHSVRGFPGLVDNGDSVGVRVFATTTERDGAMRSGLRRLLRLSTASPVKSLEKGLDPRRRLVLGTNPDGSLQALLDDCVDAAADVLISTPVWTRAEFDDLRQRVSAGLAATAGDILVRAEKVLIALREIALPESPPAAHTDAIADIRAQLAALTPKGFVTASGAVHLTDLTRYLTAIAHRLDRLPQAVSADRDRMARIQNVQQAYDELLQALSPARASSDDVRDIAWMIQELRVSLWAQQLGTPKPISEQRIYRAIDAVLESDHR
jgi:ATP-dependent helicase HrpA